MIPAPGRGGRTVGRIGSASGGDAGDRQNDVLRRVYGAVAAILRDDIDGAHVLLDDTVDATDDLCRVLAAVSFATLDRLGACLVQAMTPGDKLAMAQAIIVGAHRLSFGGTIAVEAAAGRLDAVRRHDHDQVRGELARARDDVTDRDLLHGAVAVLAATVATWAHQSGQSVDQAVAALCIAASTLP